MDADLVIIGAGAAGLAAAIAAGEAAAGTGLRIVLLDGAKRPGAKILVSGGGRCNVTHERVTPEDFCGGPRPIVRSVLRAFDERRTVAWMESLGVRLRREPTGKLFPVTDKARTVLDALLRRVEEVGVRLIAGARVEDLAAGPQGFGILAHGALDRLRARRVILATGGLSLPKSGSDGWGIALARRLGHTAVPTTPALVPLVLARGDTPGGRFAELAGVTFEARLTLRGPRGERLAERTGSFLFTHFGASGPATLDLSRHWLRARLDRPGETFTITLGHPDLRTPEEAEAWLLAAARAHPRRAVATALAALFPRRFADALAGDTPTQLGQMTREQRRRLAARLAALPLPAVRDRGYSVAETTAGGVDLREIDPRTMASRRVPGLHLCGEMLDVDGRIGGFSFQWAWSSGHVAGRAAVEGLRGAPGHP